MSSGASFIAGLSGSGMTIPNSVAVPENSGCITSVSVLSCSEYIRNTWASSSGSMVYPGGGKMGGHAAYAEVPRPARANTSRGMTTIRLAAITLAMVEWRPAII